MTQLTLGSTGDEVATLQRALAAAGFPCGLPDGQFGPGTAAAVTAFQKSHGLVADGVAGPRTQSELGLSAGLVANDASLFTVDLVAKMFPVTPRANIEKNLPGVMAGLAYFKLTDAPVILMALATIRAETEGFQPIKEGISKYNTSPGGKPYDLYDNRRDLGNRGGAFGDGASFPGGGYVQLTGRDNYIKYGKVVGADLAANPALACDAKYAGLILAAFISDHVVEAKHALLEGDLRHARRIVNGGSNGLDHFSDAYKRGIVLLPAGTCDAYRKAVA
jgi:peptidoglycan L-alanyl-D-glutamate endopeptidase CwlK